MSRKRIGGKNTKEMKGRPVSLKELAAHLDLSPATLSLVLNGAAGAAAIPREAQDRIFEAARKFDYRPNFIARSLRARRIANGPQAPFPELVTVEPELVIRQSTTKSPA